jgi:multidrug efflux pump subunit AcrB
MRIRTPDGAEYPFSELAQYEIKRSVSHINRLNRKREITVEAALADESTPLLPILQEIQQNVVPQVLSQTEGVKASYEGQSREQGKVMRSIGRAFPIAFVGMFILIILVFRSYAQAGLVFALIPLGMVGAIWGHGFHGMILNILSIYGLIALTGIVVNDSIVLIDQINRNLLGGQKLQEAVYNASLSRLRPILLTTMTTSIGLAPLIFETSRQAKFLIPMAISVAYGLLFGTFILLIVLPSGFMVLNRVRCFWAGIVSRKPFTPEQLEPSFREQAEVDNLSVRLNGEE